MEFTGETDSLPEEDGFELSVPLGGGGGSDDAVSGLERFSQFKHPNGQSKTAEAAVVKQQFDSV
jgi:hypothetical protein